MKTKTFKTGNVMCKSYLKPAGLGFEVAFKLGPKTLFCGHFVKSTEANFWYNLMNREIRKVGQKYKVGPTYPITWFATFITQHLTHKYCTYQQRLLAKHEREAVRKEKAALRKYKQLDRNWVPSEKRPVIKAA